MANATPLVSIVVPTFNRRNLLQETVDSIRAQTFSDYELIIVDNLSTDGTEEYVRSLGLPRVRYFKNDNEGVIAVNRNFGLRHAVGKYVAFCDDDDLWEPRKLETQLRLFPETGVSMVSTDFIPFGDPRFFRRVLSFGPGEAYRDFSYETILLLQNPVISSSVLARRDLLVEAGGFDEGEDFRFIEDWELWLRLSRKGKVRILSEPLLRYRMFRKEGRDARRVCLNTLKILEKHEKLGLSDPDVFRRARGNCHVTIGKAYLDADDRGGLLFFKKSLFDSTGPYQKAKAIVGMILFFVPRPLRSRLLNLAYTLR